MNILYVPADNVLTASSLPCAQAGLFSIMVYCLAGIGRSCPEASTPASLLANELGKAFNKLGTDEEEGRRFMVAAYSAVKEIHGFEQSWLNSEWHGIGLWLN